MNNQETNVVSHLKTELMETLHLMNNEEVDKSAEMVSFYCGRVWTTARTLLAILDNQETTEPISPIDDESYKKHLEKMGKKWS